MDSAQMRRYVSWAATEGFAPITVQHRRLSLQQYERYLGRRFHTDLEGAKWEHFVAYRNHVLRSGVSHWTAQTYLQAVAGYYRLRASHTGRAEDIETYERVRTFTKASPSAGAEPATQPYSLETLRRIMKAAASYRRVVLPGWRTVESEDYLLVLALTTTGARSQVYGLRVRDVDFSEGTVTVRSKGGVRTVIPLHPTLAGALKNHLDHRTYDSEFVFRLGRDAVTAQSVRSNHANVVACCRRVQRAAGLHEVVNPHRFRATFAVRALELGLDMRQVQFFMGHANINTTMKYYARAQLEEVKRAFARIDFLRPDRRGGERASERQVIAALLRLAPTGKEEAWASLVRGFAELFGASRMDEEGFSIGAHPPWMYRYLKSR